MSANLNENELKKSNKSLRSNKLVPSDIIETKNDETFNLDNYHPDLADKRIVYSIENSHKLTEDESTKLKYKLSQEVIESEENFHDNNDHEFDSDDEDDEKDDSNDSKKILIIRALTFTKSFIREILKKPFTKRAILIGSILLFWIYFGFSMKVSDPFDFPSNATNSSIILEKYVFSNNRGLALLILTIIVSFFIIWDNIISKYIKFNLKCFQNNKLIKKYGTWALIGTLYILCAIYLAIDLSDSYNLVSISGLISFLLVCVLISENPSKINFHILTTGLLIQFLLGVLLMRIEFGYRLFKFVGDQVSIFLAYTNKGSELVFGDKYTDHYFAFSSLPVIIFFGSIINLLYYLGAVQYIILKFSWIVNLIMGTSPTESMNATANVFLGMTEAPLLIKPFLTKMTKSELFSVMTGGFATVAGSVFAAYVGFGVPANHLIIASLMAAPGALLVSKTIFPESKKTKANWNAIKNLPKGEANNIFEAIAIGATNMVGLVGGIVANLIAFTAFFAFVDAILMWFFSMIGLESFGLTSIMQYLFWPFSFLMGINLEDCFVISKLIGTKIFVNEFVAYAELGQIIKVRKNITESGFYESYRNGSLPIPGGVNMIWNDRSVLISTYAICGFANMASVGIQIGGLTALAPSRFKFFTKYAVKAMIAGNITNFLSGLLFNKL